MRSAMAAYEEPQVAVPATAPGPGTSSRPGRPRVFAVVPAHNEEASIAAAVASLWAQSVRPDRVIVVADNCTDDTARIAASRGAEVWPTVGNTARKAGALNQVLDSLLPTLDAHVVTVDADTVLSPTWIEDALVALAENPGTGAVSGTYRARDARGLLPLLQRIEYHQVHRRISRAGGHVYVLSGTATMFEPRILLMLKRQRGWVYDERSIVEDFDVTLALRFNGYQPRTFKHLTTTTDVMETWGALSRQRLRWQQGTLETLLHHGWRRYTRMLWLGQVVSYLMTVVFLAAFVAIGLTIQLGVVPDPRWLLATPIFMLSQFAETRRAGIKATALAVALVPLWLYDLYRLAIYWIAAVRVVRRTQAAWH